MVGVCLGAMEYEEFLCKKGQGRYSNEKNFSIISCMWACIVYTILDALKIQFENPFNSVPNNCYSFHVGNFPLSLTPPW